MFIYSAGVLEPLLPFVNNVVGRRGRPRDRVLSCGRSKDLTKGTGDVGSRDCSWSGNSLGLTQAVWALWLKSSYCSLGKPSLSLHRMGLLSKRAPPLVLVSTHLGACPTYLRDFCLVHSCLWFLLHLSFKKKISWLWCHKNSRIRS